MFTTHPLLRPISQQVVSRFIYPLVTKSCKLWQQHQRTAVYAHEQYGRDELLIVGCFNSCITLGQGGQLHYYGLYYITHQLYFFNNNNDIDKPVGGKKKGSIVCQLMFRANMLITMSTVLWMK